MKINFIANNNHLYLQCQEYLKNAVYTSRLDSLLINSGDLIVLNSDYNDIDSIINNDLYRNYLIILVTTNDSKVNIEFNNHHNVVFVFKPFEIKTLLDKINTLSLVGDLRIADYNIKSAGIVRAIFENSKTGFMITRKTEVLETILYATQRFKDLFNFQDLELENTNFDDIFKYDISNRFEEITEENRNSFILKYNAGDNNELTFWYRVNKYFIRKTVDDEMIFLFAVSNITTSRENREIIAETLQSKEILQTNFPGAIYRSKFDFDWTFDYLSNGFERISGYNADEFIKNNQSYTDIVLPEYRNILRETIEQAAIEKRFFSIEYQIKNKNGETLWVLENGGLIFDDQDQCIGVEGIIIDINDRILLENKVSEAVKRHYLSDLYNRTYLETFINNEFLEKGHENSFVAKIRVVYIRDIIKYYGLNYVNKIAKLIADHLQELSSENQVVFNSQSNHFVIYFRNTTKEYVMSSLTQLANQLYHLINEQVGLSVGILDLHNYEYDGADNILNKLLLTIENNLDFKTDKILINYFTEEIEKENKFELAIITQLENIIKTNNVNNEFYIYSQPILNLKTDKISHIEILSRLTHPTYGFVSPIVFIKLAEQYNLIEALGELILKEAFKVIRVLDKENLSDITVSINISAAQIDNKNFSKHFNSLIRAEQIDKKRIMIELTESVYIENLNNINKLFEEMKTSGIKTAIDDFGTGYSSLSVQAKLNVDIMKIDKSFTDLIKTPDDKDSIIGDIISMIKRMGRDVIVEGVESQIHLDYLKNHNADYAQGYFISRPTKTEELIEFIHDYNNSEH